MSRVRAHVLAVELLRELPTVDLHGPAFGAWCQAHDVTGPMVRDVRVEAVRLRAFGRAPDDGRAA